jgi:hypothetical protein
LEWVPQEEEEMKILDTGETDDNDNMVAKAIAIVSAIKSTKQ